MSVIGAFVVGCFTGGVIVFLSIFFGFTIGVFYADELKTRRNNE